MIVENPSFVFNKPAQLINIFIDFFAHFFEKGGKVYIPFHAF